MPPDDAKKPSTRESLAALAKSIPLAGEPLSALILAPWGLQRAILWLVAVLLIYPVFAFVGAIFLIQHFPSGSRHWIQGLADKAFEIDTRIKDKVTEAATTAHEELVTDNGVIDGSSLLEFDVSRDDAGNASYIERVAVDQPVSFLTYQNWTLYPPATPAPGAAPCTAMPLDENDNSTVGRLLVSGVGFTYQDQFAIGYSHRSLTTVSTAVPGSARTVPAFSADNWAQIKDAATPPGGKPPATVDLLIKFIADDAVKTRAAPCTRYGIFVVMIYNKHLK